MTSDRVYIFDVERSLLSEYLQVEEKPDVTYSDVGGCKEQIEKLREVVEVPLLHVWQLCFAFRELKLNKRGHCTRIVSNCLNHFVKQKCCCC